MVPEIKLHKLFRRGFYCGKLVFEKSTQNWQEGSIPEIPPKPGELKTELLGLKERSSKVQTSKQ
ncbi:PREDICTED: uncharacterized protein C12orf73 homolog [Buceros rhinoceros silvestris]|uniref:uncharacterized protein C12orf73 homolog n=1 Tax=Buceros rhinoceros silvestris TaxID=175836 RepID=UPI0005286C1F|nr:PREDICTED: uncharacterized protein C12orf73 homolog [Buceros rhinoceros silvestris]